MLRHNPDSRGTAKSEPAHLASLTRCSHNRRRCAQNIRKIMVFLHSNGVSTSRAVRICKTYGEGAIEKVQADPYCLAKDSRTAYLLTEHETEHHS